MDDLSSHDLLQELIKAKEEILKLKDNTNDLLNEILNIVHWATDWQNHLAVLPDDASKRFKRIMDSIADLMERMRNDSNTVRQENIHEQRNEEVVQWSKE